MLETKVAKRYAKSLLDLSVEKGVLEAVANDMKLLATVCEQNREFTALMSSPIINGDKKLSILKKVFEGKMNALSFAFFEILTSKGREPQIEFIAKEFTNQYKVEKGIQTAVITSAIGLDEKLRKEVYNVIKASANSEIELVEKVNKDLIGGFVLRMGDKQFDASIASELRRLAKEFSSNPYVRKN